jgi:hypothetical protein
MASRNQRPSLMGGLIWTGLGILFLLRAFSIVPNFWSVAIRYWPILLILFGLGKIIDYFRQKEGVSLRVGEVVGVVFLILLGLFFTRLSNSRIPDMVGQIPWRMGGLESIGDWQGTSFTFNKEASYPITATMPLRVENSYGGVIVSPGSDREIRVRLRKVVYKDDEAQAKQIADEILLEGGPSLLSAPGAPKDEPFVVKTNRDSLASKDYRFRTEMEVFVPRKTQLVVRNTFGEVKVSDLEGKLDLSTSHKPLEVRDCSAEVLASSRYGDVRLMSLKGNIQVDARGKVYLEGIKGDVNVRNENAPVEIVDVDGKVSVSNTESNVSVSKVLKPVVIEARGSNVTARHLNDTLKISTSHRRVEIVDIKSSVNLDTRYCTVSLQDVKGNVEAQSNSDRITAKNLEGSLKIMAQGSGVRLNTITGPIDIETSFKDVIVNEFAGACKITNEHGDVKLSSWGRLNGDLTVKNRTGDIEVFLAENSGFQIDATARNGRVDSDFSGLSTEVSGDSGALKGKVNAGGPKVFLETEYSNIRIRAGRAEQQEMQKRSKEARRNSSN